MHASVLMADEQLVAAHTCDAFNYISYINYNGIFIINNVSNLEKMQ